MWEAFQLGGTHLTVCYLSESRSASERFVLFADFTPILPISSLAVTGITCLGDLAGFSFVQLF